MTFIVTWALTAIAELNALEQKADDPGRIRTASTFVDFALCRFPRDVGESRAGNDRLWYGDVLGVWYEVDTDAMTVLVLSVGPARRG